MFGRLSAPTIAVAVAVVLVLCRPDPCLDSNVVAQRVEFLAGFVHVSKETFRQLPGVGLLAAGVSIQQPDVLSTVGFGVHVPTNLVNVFHPCQDATSHLDTLDAQNGVEHQSEGFSIGLQPFLLFCLVRFLQQDQDVPSTL